MPPSVDDGRRLGWLPVAALAGCMLAWNAAAEPSWGMQQLMAELARVQHSTARFVERKHLKILTRPIEVTGTLEYRAPDHLERHTLTPKPERFVVDGDRLTLENARGQRRSFALQDNPVLWAFVESIRSTLNGDLATLERFYHVTLDGDDGSWLLSLTPKERRMSALITTIRIGGAAGRVDSVEIREANGDWSAMTVHEEGQ